MKKWFAGTWHSTGPCKLLLLVLLGAVSPVHFIPIAIQRAYLNSVLLISSDLKTLKAEIIYLSREQALLPCWRHSVPTWPHPAIGKKGQFIFQAHSLFIAVWWDSSWKSQSVSGETMATVVRRPRRAHRVISHGAHLVIAAVAGAEFTARILDVNSPLGPLK